MVRTWSTQRSRAEDADMRGGCVDAGVDSSDFGLVERGGQALDGPTFSIIFIGPNYPITRSNRHWCNLVSGIAGIRCPPESDRHGLAG
jgi:hypothetical protein